MHVREVVTSVCWRCSDLLVSFSHNIVGMLNFHLHTSSVLDHMVTVASTMADKGLNFKLKEGLSAETSGERKSTCTCIKCSVNKLVGFWTNLRSHVVVFPCLIMCTLVDLLIPIVLSCQISHSFISNLPLLFSHFPNVLIAILLWCTMVYFKTAKWECEARYTYMYFENNCFCRVVLCCFVFFVSF